MQCVCVCVCQIATFAYLFYSLALLTRGNIEMRKGRTHSPCVLWSWPWGGGNGVESTGSENPRTNDRKTSVGDSDYPGGVRSKLGIENSDTGKGNGLCKGFQMTMRAFRELKAIHHDVFSMWQLWLMEHFGLPFKHSLELFGGTLTKTKAALWLGTFSFANTRNTGCHNKLPEL